MEAKAEVESFVTKAIMVTGLEAIKNQAPQIAMDPKRKEEP